IADDRRPIGLLRITGPYPDNLVTFHHGIGLHADTSRNRILPRHVNAASVLGKFETVIDATEMVASEFAERQRHRAMAAAILKGPDLAIRSAEKYDRLVKDLSPERLVLHFARPCSHIPIVSEKHALLHFPRLSHGVLICHRTTHDL